MRRVASLLLALALAVGIGPAALAQTFGVQTPGAAYVGPYLGTYVPAGSPTYAPAWFDDFARTGALNGATVNGLTWAFLQGAGTNTTALSTSVNAAGIGRLTGGAGSSPNAMYGAITVPVTASKWVLRRTDTTTLPTAVVYAADDITYAGSGTWDRITNRFNSAGFSSISLAYGKAVTATTNGTSLGGGINVNNIAGDVIEERYYPSGGNTLVDVYENGQMISQGGNVTATAVAENGVFGFLGSTPATSWRYFEVGDPDTQAMIRLFAPFRVAPTDTNGDLTYHFSGDYSQASLGSVTYTLYDASTDIPVSGHTDQPVQGLAASGGAWSATSAKVLAADIPASFYLKVCRADVTGGGSICAWSPVQRAGGVWGTYGQSLMQQMWKSTGGLTVTHPAQGWAVDGSTCAGSVCAVTAELSARVTLMVDNSANATWAATMIAGGQAANIGLVRGGEGGTNTYQRRPDQVATPYASLVLGVKRAGGDLRGMIDSSGTFDAQNATGNGSVADYTANLDAIYGQLETDLGKVADSLPVQLAILGAVKSGATDANQQAIRRQQIILAASGGRYHRGPDTWHLQHLSTDPYHLTAQAYSEQARLMALAELDFINGGTTYKRGPELSSAALVDDHTVAVTFDCPNCTGMTALNTGDPDGFDGAMTFATSAANYDAATFVHATSASCAAPSGGQVVCTFGFASATFSGHAYVGGPYGLNPGNPTEDTTIENAGIASGDPTATGKAWLAGQYSGEQNVGVKTYYDVANGRDYVVTP